MTLAPAMDILPADVWAEHVAGLLADRLATRPDLVVCLPTGSTPGPVYDALPGILRARSLSTAAVTVVLLDEYVGLAAGHPARCDSMLRRGLLDRLDPGVAGFISFDVDDLSPQAACRRVDAAMRAAGGLDLVVLGLGRNGHIGMNEPGSAPDAPTRPVELTSSTRDAAIGYGADPPPKHGVTLGIAAILGAREIWLLATGAAKAEVLSRTLDGPATTDVPASLLRGHPGLRIFVDDEAARSS
ncbi:MAG: glucosamine-6-phosphate deaminase [Candidatus Limnocylindrales bacterium]